MDGFLEIIEEGIFNTLCGRWLLGDDGREGMIDDNDEQDPWLINFESD
jgi:hypothetical protein